MCAVKRFKNCITKLDYEEPLSLKTQYAAHRRRAAHYFLVYETEFVLFLGVLEISVSPTGSDRSHATLKWRQKS